MRIISYSNVILLLVMCGLALACNGNHQESGNSSIDLVDNEYTHDDEEETTLDDADVSSSDYINSLSTLVNEVSDGLNDIKNMEKIVGSENMSNEPEARKEQVRNDIMLIKGSIQDRMVRLAELEDKITRDDAVTQLKDEQRQEMLNTIADLKKQLEQQQSMIDSLTAKLNAANTTIKSLNEKVDSLTTENINATSESQKAKEDAMKAKEEAMQLRNELNECFYAVGTKKELKSHKIIESGFFKKTKVMQSSNIMHSYFTKADKRTLNEINLHSKKAKVLTNHDSQSYSLEDVNGVKVLKIYDYELFWQYTNYLVVQID